MPWRAVRPEDFALVKGILLTEEQYQGYDWDAFKFLIENPRVNGHTWELYEDDRKRAFWGFRHQTHQPKNRYNTPTVMHAVISGPWEWTEATDVFEERMRYWMNQLGKQQWSCVPIPRTDDSLSTDAAQRARYQEFLRRNIVASMRSANIPGKDLYIPAFDGTRAGIIAAIANGWRRIWG